MRRSTLPPIRWIGLLWRVHARAVVVAAAVFALVAVAAGLAFARSSPIGMGVVVIDTKLAYEGGEAAGTGIVMTSSGEILTNNHVIRGATTIRIVIPGTGHSYAARVVGYDVSADVAVLQASGASGLKTIAVGDSSSLTVGGAVTAVGNAGGTGVLRSSTGTVRGLDRAITVSDDEGGSDHQSGLVETNAPLEPGDSGGPLLSAAGKVVAIDTAASVSSGVRELVSTDAYAIPIDTAVAIADQIESGKASANVHVGATAFLGVEAIAVQDAGPEATSATGAVIAGVTPGGPAVAAGLVVGDTITAVNGHAVTTPAALGVLVLAHKPGAPVSVTYTDASGASHTATPTLASGPAR